MKDGHTGGKRGMGARIEPRKRRKGVAGGRWTTAGGWVEKENLSFRENLSLGIM